MTHSRPSSDLRQAVEELMTRVDAASAEVYDQSTATAVCEIVRETVFPFGEDGDAFVLQVEPHEVWARAWGIRIAYKGARLRVILELPRTARNEAARVQREIEAFLPRIERALGF
jgi:hypothetical protein